MSQVLSKGNQPLTAIVALGANLNSPVGPPVQSLKHAIEMLRADVKVKKLSRFYQTPCFPEGAGPDYVNAVMTLETSLCPADLLALFHRIEAHLGRVRKTRWAGRSLDLDLIAYESRILPNQQTVKKWIDLDPEKQRVETPDQLLLPHPRLHERAFVLVPLCEVWPDWVHPALGKTAQQLLDEIPPREIAKVIALKGTAIQGL